MVVGQHLELDERPLPVKPGNRAMPGAWASVGVRRNPIANPWVELRVAPPYVLPDDHERLAEFQKKARESCRLRFDVIPMPFLGNPDAPVVLLNTNPGFVPEDLPPHSDPKFVELARANLVHKIEHNTFLTLHPDVNSPGKKWWTDRLRTLVDAVGLKTVARPLLCVEWFPYNSPNFCGAVGTVPSQRYGWWLVERALDRRAVVIIMRSSGRWYSSVPGLEDYPDRYELRSRNVYISPRNCPVGFDRAVEVLKRAADTGG
jgi:hypothetical protein